MKGQMVYDPCRKCQQEIALRWIPFSFCNFGYLFFWYTTTFYFTKFIKTSKIKQKHTVLHSRAWKYYDIFWIGAKIPQSNNSKETPLELQLWSTVQSNNPPKLTIWRVAKVADKSLCTSSALFKTYNGVKYMCIYGKVNTATPKPMKTNVWK